MRDAAETLFVTQSGRRAEASTMPECHSRPLPKSDAIVSPVFEHINRGAVLKIDWTTRFPGLHKREPSIRKALIETSKIVKLPNGTRIFGPGQAPANYLLLLHGTVLVQQVSETGRENRPLSRLRRRKLRSDDGMSHGV